MKSVCFTGHRRIAVTNELIQKLSDTLEELISEGASDFYAGGAYGFDLLCEKTVLSLKKKYPHIKLHFILPCPTDEQTEKWRSDYDIAAYYDVLRSADSVEICSEHYCDGCMKKRNERLVAQADCCVCFYNIKKYASGTGQTVRTAQIKGIRIINLSI